MKILITGASGFIGSTVADEALARNMQVWAGMRRSSSKAYLQSRLINFVELDLGNKSRLMEQLKAHREAYGPWDYVVHCAGATKCVHERDFYKINFEGTRNLAQALTELDMIPQRFIYLSSLSIFGPVKEQQPYGLITDKDTPLPDTAYGKSKLMAEEFLKSLPHFPYIILRPTGVYGPREKDYFMMAQSIERHFDFAIGYRPQIITFIYVKDLVKAIFLSMEKGETRRCYFISDGRGYASRDFSDYLKRELRVRWLIRIKAPLFAAKALSLCAQEWGALWHRASTLNGDKYKIMKQRNWQCDITPAQRELGFSPDYDLERGTREMIAWYKEEGWL